MKTLRATLLVLSCCLLSALSAGSATAVGWPEWKGIYLHQETAYGMGIQVRYRPYILFENGRIYKNLNSNPATFSVAQSQKTEPEQWGRWKRAGKELLISWPGGATVRWKDKSWFAAVPPQPGEQLAGSYRAMTGVGTLYLGGDAQAVSAKEIVFQGKQFSFQSARGSSTAGMVSASRKSAAGVYSIDDSSITFKFADGKTAQHFFFYPPGGERVFCIGSTYYVRKK